MESNEYIMIEQYVYNGIHSAQGAQYELNCVCGSTAAQMKMSLSIIRQNKMQIHQYTQQHFE